MARDIFSRLAEEAGYPEDVADFARSTLQQESGGRMDAADLTSSAGAVGPMQMMPATFKAYARPGETLENPMDNARVAMRYIGDLYRKTGGDPAKMAVGYFSGEGNIAKGRSTTPWVRDARDTNGFPTSQYVQQVTGRMESPSPAPQQEERPGFEYETLAFYRRHYPEYNNRSDEELTRAVHRTHYANVPFDQFARKFGYQTTTDKAIETGKRGLGAIGDFVSGVMPRQRADIPPDLSANMPAPEADPDVLARIEQQAARRIRAPGSVMDNLIVQDPAVPMGRTPVTPQTRQRIEQAMSLPKPRAEITQRPDFVGQVGREVAGQWQRQDQLAQQTPILSGMTGRVEDLRRNAAVGGGASPDTARSIAFGQAVSGARGLPGQATESTLDFNAQIGPRRYWRDWESGVVGTTGSALSYIGRNLGADTVEQIGNSMDMWAQGRRPAVPTFADEVVSAFGSMASFYLPGVGLTKGANALSMLSPVAAKWAGAGTMAAIESAAEADQTYKTLRAQGVPHEEAARRADGTFAANLPLIGVTDRMAFFSDLKAFDDAGKLLGGNVARLAATGALTEGPLQEAPQQMIQNYFSGRPLLEGVGKSALIGALVGGGMAAAGPVAMRPSREEAFANALGEQVAGAQFAPLQMPGGTAPATPADAAQVYGFAQTPQRPGGAPRIDPNTVPAWVDVNQTLGIQGPPAPPPGASMRGELSQILSDPRSIDEITADEQRQQEEAIAESVRQAQEAQAALDAELAQQRADMQAQAAKTRQMESIAADAPLARELFAAEQAAAVARGEPEQQPLSAIQLAFQRARQQQEAPNAVQTGQQSESRVAEHQRVPQGGQVRADEGQVRQGESRQDRRRRSALERQAQQGQGGQGPVALQGEVGRAQGPTVQPVAPSGPAVAPGQPQPAATPAPAEPKPRPKLSAREQARREKLAQRQQKGSPDAVTPTQAEPQQAQPTPTAGPQPLTSAAPQGAVTQPAGTVTGASPAGLSTQQGVPPSGDTKLAQEGGGAVNPDATGSGGTAAPEKARKSRGGRIRAAAEASRTGGQAPVPVGTPVAEPDAALKPEKPAATPVAESQATPPEGGDAGVAPGQAGGGPAASKKRKPRAAPRFESLLTRIRRYGGIDSRYAEDLTGEKNGGGGAARGLFSPNGRGLDELATMLAEQDGFAIDLGARNDNGGVNQLSELIRTELDGNKVYAPADQEALLDEDQRQQDAAALRTKARKYGVRHVGRKLSDVERDVLAQMEQRHARAVALLDDRSRKVLDRIIAQADELGIDYEGIQERAATETEGKPFSEYARIVIAEVQRETRLRNAQDSGGTAEGRAGEGAAAGGRGAGVEGDQESGERPDERPDFELESQSEADLAAKAAREADEAAALREQARREADAVPFQLTPQEPPPKQTGATSQGGLFTVDGRAAQARTEPAGVARGALPEWAPVPTGWRKNWRTLEVSPGKWRIAGMQNANPFSPSFKTEAEAEAWADREFAQSAEAAKQPPSAEQIPPLYFTRTKVPVEVWIEDEGKTETVEMPAKQALDDVRRERDVYRKLLDCLKGDA